MSADLQWLIIRNNSSFLMKRKNVKDFSKEKNNLKGLNSYRFNGLVNRRTVGIEEGANGKGVVLVTKGSTSSRKPAKLYKKVELKKNSRKTFKSIKSILESGNYRKDLKMAAIRKASAVLKSQKPVVPKKVKGEKKKE